MDDRQKKFWEMRARADAAAAKKEHDAKFEKFRQAAKAVAKQKQAADMNMARQKRIGTAVAEAAADNLMNAGRKAVPEHGVRKRPAVKMLTGKLKGRKKSSNPFSGPSM